VRRRALGALLAVAAAVGLPACAQPGDGGYRLTAEFSRAVALYPHSRVKVMGVDVGTVRSIDVVRGRIRVAMRIDRKVPLPAGVQATIVPFSLIGERNVVLSPAWQPGEPRAKDGDAIPADRTHVPVEPDEALKAVTDLAHALDPNAVRKLVGSGANALRGRGNDLNTAIEQAADLTSLLASQDQTLISAAENLHTLATTLNQRREVLGKLLDDFSGATSVLSDERQSIAVFLRALVVFTDEGNALLGKYQGQLPTDVARLTQLAMTLGANADSVQQLVGALRVISDGFVAAYHRDGGVLIRGGAGPVPAIALQPLFDMLGLGPVPCVPTQQTCP
jgi:phospholipid/cholesterol/gamma-HCH transport system substrate-binding protein